MESIFITLLKLSVYSCLSFTFIKNALHMFQQNHYELRRYSKWLFDRKNIKFSKTFVYLVLIFLVNTLFHNLFSKICVLVLTIVYSIYLIILEDKKEYIKPLVVTARVKRQIAVITILFVLILLLCDSLSVDVLALITILLSYLIIYLMAIITNPIEEFIKKQYENDARRILDENHHLIKVGITGSYGKTSTKNIVNDIISDHFYTLITPSSFNTPMGITRTIREMLKPIHETFICEMGADKVNDITYLMNFVRPKYGMVTSIGPQHLATFNSIENIIHEKMQEIEMLPLDGVGFINLDNEYIANYTIQNKCKVVSVGIENNKADLVAKNIKCSKEGSEFSVKINSHNYKFKTSILGKHNITNILLGIAFALELGVDIKKIQKSVSNIQQVSHRLEIKKINNYTFIDDAFNANPVGSKMSVDVLSLMPGKRVIVTPGMIDLGKKQEEINKEFGQYMKDKVDFVILVGEKQTEPILKGLKEVDFDQNNILVCKNVKEAFAYIYSNFSTKDTILLENDLPDAFNV